LTAKQHCDIFGYRVKKTLSPKSAYFTVKRLISYMAFTQTQQIAKLIEDAKHVLIAIGENPKGDAIASACALAIFLQKRKKQVEIVSEKFSLPKKFVFLKGSEQITPRVPHLQKFLITIDVKDSGIQELSYDVKDEKLHIFVTPKSGFFTQDHLHTSQSEFRYDLIITLNTPDLTALGATYQKNSDLFHKVPLINIDHDIGNEHYGEINKVDATTCSTSEVIAMLLQELKSEAIDKEIATALLTGMISATNSFKTNNIRPHSLAVASKLVEMGADRQYIIEQLYQTKSIATLRLWGQALAHLHYDASLGLVSSTITREDFARSGAQEEDLYDIIHELIATSPDEKMTLLLHEHKSTDKKQIHGILFTEKGYDSKQLTAKFNATGDATQASFSIRDKSLKQAEELVITEIRKKISGSVVK
jgi:nanoRNase/pAp phosphatase (c-di-AMP/oligoRNAs hydrolase)